jgi:hypothetical protein
MGSGEYTEAFPPSREARAGALAAGAGVPIAVAGVLAAAAFSRPVPAFSCQMLTQ